MSLTYQIAVDLDVFKALTARIDAEGQTHNDVLRELLSLDSPIEADVPVNADIVRMGDVMARAMMGRHFYSRGLTLPSGTELRARYKGQVYHSRIVESAWIDGEGNEHSSPSAAASAITGTTVNGWRFWEARRPGDLGWRRLDVLQAK